MATEAPSVVYEFSGFRLEPSERLLTRDGRVVSLTPKAFDLIVYLVERPGRLVEKATLIAALWPDTIVEEANLTFQISTLRKALGDREDARFIETVPTRGYRFVAPVFETRSELRAAPAHGPPVSIIAGTLLLIAAGGTSDNGNLLLVRNNGVSRVLRSPAPPRVWWALRRQMKSISRSASPTMKQRPDGDAF